MDKLKEYLKNQIILGREHLGWEIDEKIDTYSLEELKVAYSVVTQQVDELYIVI